MNLGPNRQKGIVLPLTAISLLGLFGMAALALDMSHLYLNKTRLQNAVDAAALSAAKTLDMTNDTVVATDAAVASFGSNLDGPGNQEMKDALSGVDPTVQFSATVNPFVPGSGLGPYVRVDVRDFDADSWFARVWGMDQMTAGASAVSGPTPNLKKTCNILPVLACGEPDGPGFFGFEYGDVTNLKVGSQGQNEIGPGNFQFIRLENRSGANDIRDGMAGVGEQCIDPGQPIETEPGNKVGPGSDGVDTRFDICALGGDCATYDIRPDMVTTPNISYDEYSQAYADENFQFPDPLGAPERRIVVVPVGHCTQDANGHDFVDFLGLACFFLRDTLEQQGNNSELIGEFLDECDVVTGDPSDVPSSGGGGGGGPGGGGPGVYEIVLFKDTLSSDS